MKIIIENSTCSNEFAKKMIEVIGDNACVEHFENIDLSNAQTAVVLCSLGGSYDAKNVDASSISVFIARWIDYAKVASQSIKENNVSTVYLLLNREYDNLINESISKIIKDIFEQLKVECSINIIETNIELMLNSNFAQMRFGYTERFTKPNIDKIMSICNLINTQSSMNHCGVVYSTSLWYAKEGCRNYAQSRAAWELSNIYKL